MKLLFIMAIAALFLFQAVTAYHPYEPNYYGRYLITNKAGRIDDEVRRYIKLSERYSTSPRTFHRFGYPYYSNINRYNQKVTGFQRLENKLLFHTPRFIKSNRFYYRYYY